MAAVTGRADSRRHDSTSCCSPSFGPARTRGRGNGRPPGRPFFARRRLQPAFRRKGPRTRPAPPGPRPAAGPGSAPAGRALTSAHGRAVGELGGPEHPVALARAEPVQLEEVVDLAAAQEAQAGRAAGGLVERTAGAPLALAAQPQGALRQQREGFADVGGVQVGGQPAQALAAARGRVGWPTGGRSPSSHRPRPRASEPPATLAMASPSGCGSGRGSKVLPAIISSSATYWSRSASRWKPQASRMRKVSAMLAASLPPTGPCTSRASRWRRSWQAANSSSASAVGGRQAVLRPGFEHAAEPAFGQLQHVLFVVVVVRVVAEAAVAQAQPRQAQQRRIQVADVAGAAGDASHHGFDAREPGRGGALRAGAAPRRDPAARARPRRR